MPFGFSKKDKGADLDAQKSSLFSKSSKATTPSGPASSNPYAVPPPSNNPYAQLGSSSNPYASQNGRTDPYAPKSQSSLTQPPTSSFGSLTLTSQHGDPPGYDRSSPAWNRSEKSPVPSGGYAGGPPRYQSQGSYGQTSGYGGDPYGRGQLRGPGGYGGLGRNNSQDTMSTDAGRHALFGDAAQRNQQQSAFQQPQDTSYSNSGGHDSADMPGGYGSGAGRELTEEEREEEDVQAAKTEIKFLKQQDAAATRNALRIGEQITQTAHGTLSHLNIQGEHLLNTERNLDQASNHNVAAEMKTKQLKHANRSMLSPSIANPFTKKKREQVDLDIARNNAQTSRLQREATTQEASRNKTRQQAVTRQLNSLPGPIDTQNNADTKDLSFEADDEEKEIDNEINSNLHRLRFMVKDFGAVARAIGDEIDSQNSHLARVSAKTDKVDDEIALNRARLDRFR